MDALNPDDLVAACGDEAFDAGLTITTTLEPLGGPGAPVKPAIYEGGRYQTDRRWVGEAGDRRVVDAIVIDNVPSQANRLEQALRGLQHQLGLPRIELDLSDVPLPVHLPSTITSFDFPHRNADAYLRDAELDGVAFPKTAEGRALFDATPDQPAALFRWMPQALLFGFWQSHLGRKGAQTKLARSWTSEIVGYEPAAVGSEGLGVKGDPLNLSVDVAAAFDDARPLDWDLLEETRSGKKVKGEKLSELGHGQVPIGNAPLPVSFHSVQQRSTVSIAGLRRIHAHTPEASAAGRALLVALGVVAHVHAFGRSFALRSGAELRPVEARWMWLGADRDQQIDAPGPEQAADLFTACAEQAQQAGLPVGSDWPSPLKLAPRPNLRKAIESTWPAVEGD